MPVSSVVQPLLETDDLWATEVVPLLPATRDLFARNLGALQRKRGIVCASDLLRALLAYALGLSSFRLLGAWAVVLGLADLSEAAWRKRLRTSSAWLLWLLQELCAAPPSASSVSSARRVLLVDATVLGVPGGTGADWRVHTAYDFQAGHLSQVVVADRRSGEHLDHYALCAGDIVVADGGYGYRRSVATARHAHADVVLRINLATFPLTTVKGTPVDLTRWVVTGRKHLRERRLICHHGGTAYPVRVLAVRLTPHATAHARARVKTRATKHGRTAHCRTLKLAGWALLVTTLDAATWPPKAVLKLYRTRWQIELVFKRLKSVLQLDHLRVSHPQAVEAVVRLVLIGWLLHAHTVAEIRAVLADLQAGLELPPFSEQPPISSWRLTCWGVITLQHYIVGQWTMARVHACQSRLERFFSSGKRQRPQLESQLRHWLAACGA